MSSVREYVVVDPNVGRRRAYMTSTVAKMADVTPKTVTTWVANDGASAPAPLRGWAPKTDANPSGRWLIDADLADEAFGRRVVSDDAITDAALLDERARLDEERAVFDLERRVFEQSRIEQLENKVAQLTARNERLENQVSKLGGVIRDLTSDALA